MSVSYNCKGTYRRVLTPIFATVYKHSSFHTEILPMRCLVCCDEMIRLSVTDLTKGIKKIIPKEEMWERGSNSTNTDLIKECKCKTKSIRSDSVMLISRNAT
jgi:hypothetical protein